MLKFTLRDEFSRRTLGVRVRVRVRVMVVVSKD